jgi:hypothetical protein
VDHGSGGGHPSKVSLLRRCAAVVVAFTVSAAASETPIALGDQRELFVDRRLIDVLEGAQLFLHEPRDEGSAVPFDQPWEGPFSAYCTVLRDGETYRAYYRGKATGVSDGKDEVTCVAESKDGVHWSKPRLGLIELDGSKDNNIVFAADGLSHNFSPLIDTNPATAPEQRYKAIGGSVKTGLVAFSSPDGFRWSKLREEPVLTRAAVPYPHMFDSQNLAFWSPTEKRYLMYFRVLHEKVRRIARVESTDFVNWSNLTLMEYRAADGGSAPIEHLYTNQTAPYFRAPQLSVSLAARFMPGRRVLTDEEAAAIQVHPRYFKDTSDAIFMTTRGGGTYDRTFPGAFIRPGLGAQNWVSRTTYPALGVVQTSPTEMSVYANQDYAQPTAHLRRYSLRLDGFASVRAPYEGGTLTTKALTFKGGRLMLNFATSAAGGVRVELRDDAGQPIPGHTLADSVELIGNEIERAVRWKGGDDISKLAGKPVRMHFAMKDADLYALRFAGAANASETPAKIVSRQVAIENVCAWPNLTVLRDGTIIASIFGRPSHGQVAGDAECWASSDGLKWEKRGHPAPNEPETNRMNLAAGLAKNGDLVVLCSGWTNVKQPQRPKQPVFRDDILRSWVCRSSDGGRTWTQTKEFPAPEPGWSEFIPFGDIFAGEDGALHTSCYAGEFTEPAKSTKTKSYRAWHFRSDDDGRTWQRGAVIGEKHNETSLFHLGGKRWMAAARIDAVELFRSEDDGATWQGPQRVTARNEINAHLQRLQDGRLLLSYGNRVRDQFGVLAKLSSDEGKTWSDPLRLARTLDGDCGYPSSVQRPDGKIVTAFYAHRTADFDRYQMGVVIWEAPVAAAQ